ncbi:G-patch domain-containing protein [Mycena indigotica]|uniref:G-patch domain-containing protein n=1 Tax=Mycena indigotica TaxID=2126181 RepID=A0A8H6WE07_9AGAR|nr:G-patch domain-containing protein [Mycena indigotica]KAF7315209.1 G-patch domain-containing protein [Mycena indigotica]
MGLSGRKTKQRIGNDPRNLTWADDAAKFGATYLSKFGWDASKGLGAEGEGRLSHIKVSQKLDMLGIGAAQQKDPNGIAWKQNRDFERVLERLNATQDPTKSTPAPVYSDFVAASVAAVDAVKPVVPRHRAHRARAIAAKNIASKSAAAISEILGVASSSSTTAATPEGTLTPCGDSPDDNLITTSKKSVADYFKDKLLAKSGKSTPAPATPVDDIDMPRGGIGSRTPRMASDDAEAATPRFGIGSSRQPSFMPSTSALPVPEEKAEEGKAESKSEKRKHKDKKGKARESDVGELTVSEAKKEKKAKRRKDKEADVVQPEEPSDEPTKKKKKRRRENDKTEDKSESKKKKRRVEEPTATVEMAKEDRKKAKKEKKRLKALEDSTT